jgi:hypothetical protein
MSSTTSQVKEGIDSLFGSKKDDASIASKIEATFTSNTNAIFEFDKKKRKLIEYSYGFSQATDKDNQPSGIPRGGRLKVKVDAITTEKNADLLNWMVKGDMKKEVKITIKKPSKPKEDLKTLTFSDAFCVDYKETWKDQKSDNKGDSANTEDIEIAWRKLEVCDVTYENGWE